MRRLLLEIPLLIVLAAAQVDMQPMTAAQKQAAQQRAQHQYDVDLFDKAFMNAQRKYTTKCDPWTLEDCSERERLFAVEHKEFTLLQIKNATESLRKHEREMAAKGKPLKGDDDQWVMERKSILIHLLEHAEDARRYNENYKWAKQHDEL